MVLQLVELGLMKASVTSLDNVTSLASVTSLTETLCVHTYQVGFLE